MPCLRCLVWLFLSVWLGVVHAQPDQVGYGPVPGWVDQAPPVRFTPTPADDVAHGYDFLLLDTQVDVGRAENFYRSVYRITAENALQSGARFTWGFDPSYEKLTLHHVRLIRDGVEQNRLDPSKVQVIQQERDLDRHMLDGKLTALLILEDVRVGDVIDYALTRAGDNPVFGGRYIDTFSTGWGVPVRHQRLRLVTPSGRALTSKLQGESALKASTTRQGDQVIHTWEGKDLPVIDSEDQLPGWFSPYPFLQLAEFASWRDVVDWAVPLYALADPLPEAVTAKAISLTRGLAGPEEKAKALLKFVQQDIRYLGLELGAGSHRPNPPEVVLSRRFGDCKDKVVLFCALMRAAGLAAHPALVNTRYRDRIGEWIATPYAFDHVIACVPLEGRQWWVNPTMRYQEGGALTRGLPDYRLALLVRPGGDRLVEVSRPTGAARRIEINEQIDVDDFDVPARLKVVSRYSGLAAETLREYFATTALPEITKSYVNYYAATYPGLSSAAPITWRDEQSTNTLVVEEHYRVPDLWKAEKEGGVLKADFYPQAIADYVVQPQTRVRAMPLSIPHPVTVIQTTRVNLHQTWSVTPMRNTEVSAAFKLDDSIEGSGNVVTMKYRWESLADHVPPEKIGEHVETVERVRKVLGYHLTHDPAVAVAAKTPPAFRFNWMPVVVILIVGTMVFYAARKIYALPPATPPPLPGPGEERLVGLGGWLVLVGFGLILRPIMLGVQLVRDFGYVFNLDMWEALTTPGSEAYQAAFAPLIIGEIVGNMIVVGLSLLLIVLYFARKRAFPKVFVAWMLFSVVFIAADTWVANAFLDLPAADKAQGTKDITRLILQSLIWVPYMLVSRRVALTFTR